MGISDEERAEWYAAASRAAARDIALLADALGGIEQADRLTLARVVRQVDRRDLVRLAELIIERRTP